MKHNYLMTPGPSPLLPEVKAALGRDIIHHRTEEFREVLKEAHEGLKYLFQTKNPVLIFSSSGTGAMEAAVSNFLKKEDKALVVMGGKFGERWKEICESFGVETVPLNVEWGNAPLSKDIEKLLDTDSGIKAVYTTLCETSTAAVYDIKSIAEVTRKKGLLCVVDAVSGLGQDVLKTDEWGVDVVVSGSQKGLMLPPGLAFLSFSKKAEKFLKESDLPKYYFDLKKASKSWEKNDTPFTPSVSLIFALRESLRVIREEGLETRWKDFEKMGRALRSALTSLGFEILSKSPSSSVTAALVKGIDTASIVKKMRKEYGISIAGGQGHLKGKIVRIAHMGYINPLDIVMCLSVLEKVLADLGLSIEKGVSLKAFQEVYYA